MIGLTRNTTLGLALFVALGALLGWRLLGSPHPGGAERVVWATFDDASTIIHFDRNVRVAGANAGTIGRIERRGTVARVQLRLGREVGPVRRDARAVLRPHTLFDGSVYVDLTLGSPGQPPIDDRGIPRSRTASAMSLDRALRVLDAPTRQTIPRVTARLRRAIGPRQMRAVRRTLRATPPLLGDLRRWSAAARGRGRSLRHAVERLSLAAGAVATVDTSIAPTIRDADRTLAAVAASDAALDETLALLPGAADDLRRRGGAARELLGELGRLSEELLPTARALPATLDRLDPLLRRTPSGSRHARRSTSDLRAALAAVATGAGPATTLVDAAQETLRLTDQRLLPFLTARSPNGATVIENLAGLAGSAAGTLSPLTAPGPGSPGGGHIWQMTPTLLPVQPGCASIGDPTIRRILEAQELCVP